MTVYPTFEDTVAIHAVLIRRFGGSLGIRDRGALESALARPRSGYYHDVIEQSAALWESLSQNHPFIDGNKRVAVTVTAAFLKVNGYTRCCSTILRPLSFSSAFTRTGGCASASWTHGCASTSNRQARREMARGKIQQ